MAPPALETLLGGMRRDLLRTVAQAHGIREPLPRKPRLVRDLALALSDKVHVAGCLQHLPPIARRLFESVQEHGGQASSLAIFHALQGEEALEAPPNEPEAGAATAFCGALWLLQQYALVLSRPGDGLPPTPETLANAHAELVIPAEVLEAAPAARRPLRVLSPDVLDRIEEGAPHIFQRDLYLYWNYLRGTPIELTAGGLVPKRHLARLNEVVVGRSDLKSARDETQAHRLYFARLIMEEAGLARREGRKLHATPGAHEFFGFSLARRVDRCYQAWRRTVRWNELLHLPLAPRAHEERPARTLQVVARARQAIVTLIETGWSDGWIALDDAIARMRTSHYEFLFKRTREDHGEINPYYYYHNPLGWGFPVANERDGWEQVERELIISVISRALLWMGMVSLGYRAGTLTAFRLTPLGAYLLGFSTLPPPEESAAATGRVIVQPNFQIFALEPIAEHTLSMLDRFADRVKADKVYEYRLSRESLYRALQKGLTSANVVGYLVRASGTTLPQNVQRTLEEWGQSYDRIVVRRGVALMHTRDSALLDALQADADAAPLLLSRPMPGVALSSGDPQTRRRLLEALHARAQLPAFTEGPEDWENALTLDADGRVRLLHPVPNLFLLEALKRHAELRSVPPDAEPAREENGAAEITQPPGAQPEPAGECVAYYLTEKVVKADRDAGESVDEIIARWQRWHHGPLPQGLINSIRRWGRFYGKARLRPMRLVQLPGAEVACALLEDPEIGPLLHPYPADPAALFVADEDVAQVSELLEARGIPLVSR